MMSLERVLNAVKLETLGRNYSDVGIVRCVSGDDIAQIVDPAALTRANIFRRVPTLGVSE